MAVAFDAVGPSSAGALNSNRTVTWTHTCVGNGVALVVGVAVSPAGPDNGNDSIVSISAKLDPAGANTTMPALGVAVHSAGNVGTANGFVQLFGLPNVASGAHTITVTEVGGGIPQSMEGGSVSYTGADLTAPFQGQQSSAQDTNTAPTITHIGSITGNMVCAALAHGDAITSVTVGTSRWIRNVNSGSAAGNGAMADKTGGGSQTFTWAANADKSGIAAVEILVPYVPIEGRILLENNVDRLLLENDDLLVSEDYVSVVTPFRRIGKRVY